MATVLTAGATAAGEDSVSVEAGIRVGANITGWFENLGGRGNTIDESGPLVIGPMIGIRFLRLFGIEAEALYTRADRISSWSYGGLAHSSHQESGSVWEFPVLGKVRVPVRFAGLRPFVVAGPVWYRLRTTDRYSGGYYGQRPDGQLGWIESSGTNRLSESGLGAAVGGGLERLVGRARLSLEGRFSRWPAQYTGDEVRRRQSSQFAVFAGFGF